MPRTSSTWLCMAWLVTLKTMSQSLHTDPPNSNAWSASEMNDLETLTCPNSPKTLTKHTKSQSTHSSNDTIHIIINQPTNHATKLLSHPVSPPLKLIATVVVAVAPVFSQIIGLAPSFDQPQGPQERDPCCGEQSIKN